MECGTQTDLTPSKESEETMSKLDKSAKKTEPVSFLDLMCGSGEHSCDGRSCVRIQSFQKEDLATCFGDITEKEKSEVQIVAECYTNTTVNIATALGFLSRMCSLQSLEMLEGVRAPLGGNVECGVMAWGVANNPEAHQRVEDWS